MYAATTHRRKGQKRTQPLPRAVGAGIKIITILVGIRAQVVPASSSVIVVVVVILQIVPRYLLPAVADVVAERAGHGVEWRGGWGYGYIGRYWVWVCRLGLGSRRVRVCRLGLGIEAGPDHPLRLGLCNLNHVCGIEIREYVPVPIPCGRIINPAPPPFGTKSIRTMLRPTHPSCK